MQFEWDEAKRRAVKRKHGIDLADVPRAFYRPMLEEFDLGHSISEDRWRAIALLDDRVVVLVYTYRSDSIRLISARPAEPHEERLYFEDLLGHPL